jgi:hypothetical protein
MTWISLAPELTALFMAAVFFCTLHGSRFWARINFFIAALISALGVLAALSALGGTGRLFAHVYQLNFSPSFSRSFALGLFWSSAYAPSSEASTSGSTRNVISSCPSRRWERWRW